MDLSFRKKPHEDEPVKSTSPEVAVEAVKLSAGQVSLSRRFQLFLVPLVAILIFVGILILLVIPGVSGLFAKLEETDTINAEVAKTNEDIASLETLSKQTSVLNTDIQYVNKIAPAGTTEVVRFQQRITQLANNHGLNVTRSQTDEQALRIEGASPILGIIEIPSTFTLTGKFSNVKSFIESIKSIEDFVIIGEMQIQVRDRVSPEQLTSTNLNWTLTITLIKYQFQQPDEQNKLAQAYKQVPPTVKIDPEVLEFIRSKYGDDSQLLQNF